MSLLARPRRTSLRTKLAGGFVAVIALTVIAGVASWRSQQRALSAVEQYVNVSDRIADLSLRCSTAMMKARRNEKDFLLRERELGFPEARSRYGTLLQAEVADIRQNMGLIRRLGPDVESTRLSLRIEEAAGRYESGFARLLELYGRLGQVDRGLEGAFREKAHELESLLEVNGDARLMADLLALRRHEKDFLLRGLDKYVRAHGRAMGRFRADLAAAPLARREKARLSFLAGSYQRYFQEYVEVRSQVQPTQAAYLSATNEVEPLLENLYARSAQSSLEMRATVHRLTRATGWTIACTSLIAATVGLLVAFLISRSITRSVRTCMAFADRIAQGTLNTRMAQEGEAEFRELAGSLNAMADALVGHERALRTICECDAALVRAADSPAPPSGPDDP